MFFQAENVTLVPVLNTVPAELREQEIARRFGLIASLAMPACVPKGICVIAAGKMERIITGLVHGEQQEPEEHIVITLCPAVRVGADENQKQLKII